MAAHGNRGDNQKARTLHVDGKDKCDLLASILEKAYFETHNSKEKKFLAGLLSKLA